MTKQAHFSICFLDLSEQLNPILISDLWEWGAPTAKGNSLLSFNREAIVRGKAPSPATQMSKHRV